MTRRIALRLAGVALALALAAAAPARAQSTMYQPVRVDLTAYVGYASADATSWGFGAALEAKYHATDHLAAGLRFEGAGFITQDVTVGTGADTSVEQGARASSAFLAKADWYFGTSTTRPFVGLGLGYYRIGAGSQSIGGGGTVVQTAAAFRGFGFCPQVGVNFGAFRLAATYHVVGGGDMTVVTQAEGAPATEVKLAKNWFAFEIGGTIGGRRL
ncbi:MAG TPA: hypothetical protein VFL83_13800 [Anaeromyxobacter sp.]|nr:hypothetical protein [Anaeromyxobacter sp.]